MKRFLLSLAIIGCSSETYSQMTCDYAVRQLTYYAQNVNQQYVYYYNNAGNFCGYNWAWCLNNLNNWYYQQCLYVNQCYQTIAYQCAERDPQGMPAPDEEIRDRKAPRVNTRDIDDLKDDIADAGNGRKSVRLEIPKDPVGWQPR